MNQRMHAALKTDSWEQGNLIICRRLLPCLANNMPENTIFMMRFDYHDLCLMLSCHKNIESMIYSTELA